MLRHLWRWRRYDPPSPVKPCAGTGVQFQNAWLWFMALVMLLFSASLFGLFEFQSFPHL